MLPVSASDIVKFLEQVPIWKSIVGLPKRIAALEARVAELEKAAGKPVNDATNCPKCGTPMSFVSEAPDHMFGDMGVKVRRFQCDDCGFATDRQWTTSKGYD